MFNRIVIVVIPILFYNENKFAEDEKHWQTIWGKL